MYTSASKSHLHNTLLGQCPNRTPSIETGYVHLRDQSIYMGAGEWEFGTGPPVNFPLQLDRATCYYEILYYGAVAYLGVGFQGVKVYFEVLRCELIDNR